MKRALVLPALLLTFGLASCGSDSDDTAADTTDAPADATDAPRGSTEAPTEETEAPTEETEAPTEETEAPEATTGDTAAATPGTGGSADDTEACAALRVISDYDEQSNEALAGGTDIEPIKQLFAEATPDVVAAYERVAAAEPDLADEASTLSDFTEAAAEASKEAADLGELVTAILALPGVMEAGAAGVALNTYAEENCGFSTGNRAA